MGETIHIQGINVELPEPPARRLIQNWDKSVLEQNWERTPLPTFHGRDIDVFDNSEIEQDDEVSWEEAVRQEQIKITGCDPEDLDRSGNPRPVAGVKADPEYFMDCLEAHRLQELDRIHNGHWIYIKGKAYWLPGPYYFYLNYWWVGDAVPAFRYPDLELMWLWEFVRKHPMWLGIIYITMRSTGKSYLGGAIDYWTGITKKEAHCGMQSKSGPDAEKFFREKVLIPVSKLPEFLRGIHRDMYLGDITNNSEIVFSPPPRKRIPSKVYAMMKKLALNSIIDYGSSTDGFYDGQSLSFYMRDEIGKDVENDVNKAWNVVFNSVWRGSKKRGSAWLTSTVEEMEKGGENCKKIWDRSNPLKLNENGRTDSGLVRYFRSAIDATYFDEWGFPDREASKTYHDNERNGKEGSDLVSYKQKNPYTAEEAFWITSADCIYNQEILLAAKDYIFVNKHLIRTGDIHWVEKDKKAEFVDNEHGFWQVSFFNFEQNKVTRSEAGNLTFTPGAADKRIMAVDPYQTEDLADENRGSDGAAAVYNRFDMNIPEEFCDTFIADYLGRPKDPFVFYEHMIMGAFYFGCPMFIEKNKSNMFDYLRTRGYKWGYDANPSDFVWERPRSMMTKSNEKESDGLYQGPGTITHYTNSTAVHINQHGYKLKHVRIIDDWIKFNPFKTKEFDMAVAASMAVVGAERNVTSQNQVIDLSNLMGTFNNQGHSSERN